MTRYKTAELSGALLDAAVAECGEWKTAHEHFPTMTLDSTFQGYYIIEYAGEKHCMLRPRNPMRQDPQYFRPSTDWAIGGPIIQRERICIDHDGKDTPWTSCYHLVENWGVPIHGSILDYEEFRQSGPTPLIAAMRSYVEKTYGDEVELHD